MKDIPSHMMKFMRKVTKKNINDQIEDDESYKKEYRKPILSKKNKQESKKKKTLMKQEVEAHIPKHLSIDEKNKKMKKRIPEFRERSHKMELRIKK